MCRCIARPITDQPFLLSAECGLATLGVTLSQNEAIRNLRMSSHNIRHFAEELDYLLLFGSGIAHFFSPVGLSCASSYSAGMYSPVTTIGLLPSGSRVRSAASSLSAEPFSPVTMTGRKRMRTFPQVFSTVGAHASSVAAGALPACGSNERAASLPVPLARSFPLSAATAKNTASSLLVKTLISHFFPAAVTLSIHGSGAVHKGWSGKI